MAVPLLNLTRLHASIGAELEEAVRDVVNNSAFVGRAASAIFEDEFGAAMGMLAAGCGSGTDALALALRATGIQPGDEVIVPAMTFVATAEAVIHAGAVPVVVDVDPATLLIDEEDVARVRSSRARAVLPVHLYGHVVPFGTLADWGADGLSVIEDGAQAHLATYRGSGLGTMSEAACFSFYPGKNLGAMGDGGLVASRDASLVDHVRKLRDHGRQGKYVHEEIGWCSRLDGLQAAILRVKLRRLPEWTDARRRIARVYRERLAERSGVTVVPWEDGAVHHVAAVRVAAAARDQIRSMLTQAGIETAVHYPVPLSLQPSLAEWARPCPEAEKAADELVSLPIDPLMTDGEVDAVCTALLDAVGATRAGQ